MHILAAKEDNAVWEVISAQKNHIPCPLICTLRIEGAFLREVLENFLNDFFMKLSIFLQILEETKHSFLNIIILPCSSVTWLNSGLWMLVPSAEQDFWESSAGPDDRSYKVL